MPWDIAKCGNKIIPEHENGFGYKFKFNASIPTFDYQYIIDLIPLFMYGFKTRVYDFDTINN